MEYQCPLVGKHCIEDKCALWLGACAITKIATNLEKISSDLFSISQRR